MSVTVPVPAFQDPLVDPFVHVPAIVQVPDPKAKYEAAEEIATLPAIVALPDVEVIAPPPRVTLPFTVSVFVPFAKVPPFTLSAPAVSWLPCVMVPAEIVRTLNDCVAPRVIVAAALKTTVEAFALSVAPAAVDVQLPETVIVLALAVRVPFVPIETVPAAMARLDPEVLRTVLPVAPPAEFWMVRIPPTRRPLVAIVYVMPAATLVSKVRLLNSLTPRFPKVRVPVAPSRIVTMLLPADHNAEVDAFVHVPVTVQVLDARTMYAFAVDTLTLPLTVTAEPSARRAPRVESVRVPTATARFEALVSRVVAPVAPAAVFWIVKVPPTRSPRVLIVYVIPAGAVVSKTALLNSFPARFDPAKVIVADAAPRNVTVPVPADQEAEVLAFVQVPPTVHVSEPKEMNDAGAEIRTFPVTAPAPDEEVRFPPDRVRLPAESVAVPFASDPPETVKAALTVVLAARVEVPAVTVRLLNACVIVIAAFALTVTVLVPAVNVALGALTVQFPAAAIVDPRARRVPFVPIVTAPATMPRFEIEVSRTVLPVAPPAEF